MPQALEGIRVLDLSSGPAGGIATMILADFGAEVLNIAPVHGDPMTELPVAPMWQRGKRSLTLDLTAKSAIDTLHELCAAADVLVCTWQASALETKGLDWGALHARQRNRLERLCRYVTRPAIYLERLTVRPDGQIQYELKNPFRNGTTHILFSPLDFLSKLAALVPRPHHNLVRYHGIFAPNSKMRKLVVPKSSKRVKGKEDSKTDKSVEEAASELIASLSWAQRLKRVFNIDITLCPLCGGTMRVIADITDPDIIQKILDHIEAQPPPNKPVTAIQS